MNKYNKLYKWLQTKLDVNCGVNNLTRKGREIQVYSCKN